MKNFFTITLLIFTILISSRGYSQNIKKPLPPKVNKELVTKSPGENWTWVKGHWTWDETKYVWIRGMYIEIKEGYHWMDGEWERNQKTGWWSYNEGYWQKGMSQLTKVSIDANTTEEEKKKNEKRKDNYKVFIRTGE